MQPDQFSLVEIVDFNDPLFLDWLDLYETAFPFNERMLVSSVMKSLKRIGQGSDKNLHYLALVDEDKNCLGLMVYYTYSELQAAWLWYLAVKQSERSKGLGSYLYRQLLQRLDPARYKLLVFEVEIPGAENTSNADRRIAFYKRQGALLVEGIRYIQEIGWHSPPTHLHLMVHPLQPLSAEQAFALVQEVFGGAVEKVGEVALVGDLP